MRPAWEATAVRRSILQVCVRLGVGEVISEVISRTRRPLTRSWVDVPHHGVNEVCGWEWYGWEEVYLHVGSISRWHCNCKQCTYHVSAMGCEAFEDFMKLVWPIIQPSMDTTSLHLEIGSSSSSKHVCRAQEVVLTLCTGCFNDVEPSRE